MATREGFADKFRELLRDVPENYTLEQWQHAYRQAIFLMGMKILERFESEAIAPPAREGKEHLPGNVAPANPEILPGGVIIWQIASHGGGSGTGGNPSLLGTCHCRVFPDYPLALQAPLRIKGRERSRR